MFIFTKIHSYFSFIWCVSHSKTCHQVPQGNQIDADLSRNHRTSIELFMRKMLTRSRDHQPLVGSFLLKTPLPPSPKFLLAVIPILNSQDLVYGLLICKSSIKVYPRTDGVFLLLFYTIIFASLRVCLNKCSHASYFRHSARYTPLTSIQISIPLLFLILCHSIMSHTFYPTLTLLLI